MAASPLSEFSLIDRYFARRAQRSGARAVLGIGDDCALLAPKAGTMLAISTDMLVEGRHFFPEVPPRALGHKTLAVNLSDLAAMGAQPRAFTLAFALPRADAEWLDAFADGLFTIADRHGCELVGGDTTSGPLNLCVTVFGDVGPDRALRRDAARAGDEVWVSGTLGDARAGLGVARGEWTAGEAEAAAFRRALEWPEPRVALGLALAGVAHAALDLSDGLAGDLRHILERSRVAAEIDVDAVPRSAALATLAPELQRTCTLAGGDDYELCFTAPAAAHSAVLAAAETASVPVTRIGTIRALAAGEAPGIRWRDGQGAPLSLTLHGFDHFHDEQ
ncbi:thiamine-phosphate kinase [Burkholderia gladioli]|uniref:thiamine-phosphate kinase n=1 Tax=Burkholderia gladioli TaxID=28095 RepID=UPI00163E5E89|nr:thiamine-phosphate kinase [Burkholderia gladioli]